MKLNKADLEVIARIASTGQIENAKLTHDRLGVPRIVFSGTASGEFVLNDMNPKFVNHVGHNGRTGIDVSESEGRELISIWNRYSTGSGN